MGIFKKFLGLFGMKFTNDVSEGIVWPNAPEKPELDPKLLGSALTSDYWSTWISKKTYERDSRGRFKKKGSE